MRLLWIDDPDGFRNSVLDIVREELPGAEIVAIESRATLDAAFERRLPGVAVVDPASRTCEGIPVVEELRRRLPDVAVVVFTSVHESGSVSAAVRAGADGYVLKTEIGRSSVSAAIRSAWNRIESERRAADTEKRLGFLLERLGVGVFRTTASGQLVEGNDAFLRILGFQSLDEARRSSSVTHYASPADRAVLLSELRRNGAIREREVELRRQNGAPVWVSLTETLVEGSGMDPFIDGIMEDITSRRIAEDQRRRVEDQLRMVVTAAPVLLFVTDAEGRITLAEGRGLEAIGRTPADLQGQAIWDLYADRPDVLDRFRRAYSGERISEVILTDGRSFDTVILPRTDTAGRVTGVMGVGTDITHRQRALDALRERENLLQAIVDAEPECVILLDQEGTVLDINRAGLVTFEVADSAGLLGRPIVPFLLPPYRESFGTVLSNVFGGESDRVEFEILGAKESRRWMEAHVVPLRGDDGVMAILGIFRDVTERRRAEEQRAHSALHDPLTGLANRSLFMERLAHAVDMGARRRESQFALLILDIDRFQVVIDSLGHSAGDQLLILFAKRLEHLVGSADTVARVGGDEFGILLDGISDVAQATKLAERIQSELEQAFPVAQREIVVTASIGIAHSRTGYVSADEVQRDADIALHRAKSAGKARYQMFDSGMHAQAVTRLQLETDLRRAIEREELRVVYQPIFDLETGSVAGFEALLRWHHPEHGDIVPNYFIPLAEETGLIVPLGEWVFRSACVALHAWSTSGLGSDLLMSVNLSANQFRQRDLVDVVTRVLSETGVPGHRIRLELTESAILDNAEAAATVVQELRARGIGLLMDDFGTGYSSLSNLRKFAIDGLKIDRSFIQHVGEHRDHTEIVRSIVSLARNLDIDVIAEGVETERQVRELRQLGCRKVQGFHFSLPLHESDARELLRRRLAG